MILERVVKFYNLTQFVNSKAIYFSVHRTHYGLPQAGALSQQRLFKHLEQNTDTLNAQTLHHSFAITMDLSDSHWS